MQELAAPPANRYQLWFEFALLFGGVPIAMAVFFGSYSLFATIWVLAAIAALLLAVTPGFQFRQLRAGPVLREWRIILAYTVLTTATCLAFVFWLVPERFLDLPQHRTNLWLMIMVGYPIASALPQEVIFRSLFFERYGVLFRTASGAILVNGAVFGFGHLFYLNPVTIAMTAIGGAIFGWVYLHRGRSLILAWLLHSLAGQIIFTTGLGIFFYHGAVGHTP